MILTIKTRTTDELETYVYGALVTHRLTAKVSKNLGGGISEEEHTRWLLSGNRGSELGSWYYTSKEETG